MFNLRNNEGFSLEFSNGMVVSVIFGRGSHSKNKYCEPRDLGIQSTNAEFAVIDKEGSWATQDCFREVFSEELGDDVAGYRSANDLAKVIAWAESQV